MATYFISDIHLGLGSKEVEKRKENLLLGFLKAIYPSTERLFIVGDLFDFWFEYATVIPKGFHRTLAAIQEFTDSRIPVHYLAGNHDFWMGDYFTSELGVDVHVEPYETTIEGKRVYLHHGDGLAVRDLGYKIIKPVLRNRLNVRLYRWLHPDIGVRLAKRSSLSSREYTSHKQFGEDSGMIEWATKKIREGVDIVVMGHRHSPHIMTIEKGLYVNLGDWISFNTYGEFAGGSMTLKTWEGLHRAGRPEG
jgi:UDP-2,3-diacylglucosamine hydrolase